MNVHDFEKIVRNEQTARHFVLTRCSMTAPFRCPRCGGERLYEVEGGRRRRCARCGHTFNPFAARYLDDVKLSAREWLWIVKLFELEMSATIIANETGISYPTILKTLDAIRRAIADARVSSAADAGTCAEDAPDRVLGARNGGGPAEAEPLPAGTVLFHFRMGTDCIVMTGRTAEYSRLICEEKAIDVVDYGRNYPKLRVYCSAKGFWPYAKERFAKYHGIPFDRIHSYVEEMSFRWLNRGTPLFDLILERLCRYAPTAPARKRARAEQLVH